ncbi:MAG: polyprenyl synthetase family protein [Oscillospiraceae bacterium]|nr:polyprenyl synthetase family protein [Oscillospiraceae bacterium]
MRDFQDRYQVYFQETEAFLQTLFTDKQPYDRLQKAMRYSLLGGGKRIRPVLTLAFCDLLRGSRKLALPLACALELVHTYSLIHDDLPCMDDDNLRRGRPTCHVVFGEAVAVLAGDALLTEAFGLIAAAPELSGEQKAEAAAVLAGAAGGNGMVAGQILDVEKLAAGRQELTFLYGLKTGMLLKAAAELGCIAAGGDGEARKCASDYAAHLGLAFQVRDDMLDVTANEQELGKPVGSDRAMDKYTFVDLIGLDACGALVEEETKRAKLALAGFQNSHFLCRLADSLADRRK